MVRTIISISLDIIIKHLKKNARDVTKIHCEGEEYY